MSAPPYAAVDPKLISADFASNYPPTGSPPTTIPQAWLDKLNATTLPSDNPVSTNNNGYPTYSNGIAGADPRICSFTYQCTTDDDLVNPPANVWAVSFDDGPTPSSPELLTFLTQNNISDKATHFMIGSNMVYDPMTVQQAFNEGGHIAVHTWSHLYTTTLTNEQVLAELGWTMQIISDCTGGYVPKYWRPPYGDVDNRVRAIAKGVFGLETVPWNQDTGDWAIGHDPAYTIDSVESAMTSWFTGTGGINKSVGITVLEHELNNNTVGVFMHEYPIAVQNNWQIKNIPEAFGMDWYLNSKTNQGAPVNMTVGAAAPALTSTTPSATPTSATATAGSSAASGASAAKSTATSATAAAASASSQVKAASGATRSTVASTSLLLAGVAVYILL